MSNGDSKMGQGQANIIKVPDNLRDDQLPPLSGVTSDLSTAGVSGFHRSRGPGVFGKSDGGGPGVSGFSRAGDGVVGRSQAGDKSGVWGGNTASGPGVAGSSASGEGILGVGGKNGVHGQSASTTDSGVWGENTGQGFGVAGSSAQGIGIFGQGGRLAGRFEGDVEVTGDIRLVNADCAEDFDISAGEQVEPGTVMVIDETGSLQQSRQPYDRRVAGVISGADGYKPGIVLDRQHPQLNRKSIALLGKVYCKVDTQYGAIQVGDLLTTSPTPGHAMKADDPLQGFGAVIGKALRPLSEGKGLIPILIALQ